jgi:hypothetical protein
MRSFIDNSRYEATLTLDEFVSAILEDHNSGGAAAFAAAILDEGRSHVQRRGEAADIFYDDWLDAIRYGAPVQSTARFLREADFDPNEP